MVQIAIGDWFLSRSDGFKVIVQKLRDHKISTKQSFSRVKRKHNDVDRKLEEYDKKIREIEMIISSICSETPQIIKKRRK